MSLWRSVVYRLNWASMSAAHSEPSDRSRNQSIWRYTPYTGLVVQCNCRLALVPLSDQRCFVRRRKEDRQRNQPKLSPCSNLQHEPAPRASSHCSNGWGSTSALKWCSGYVFECSFGYWCTFGMGWRFRGARAKDRDTKIYRNGPLLGSAPKQRSISGETVNTKSEFKCEFSMES